MEYERPGNTCKALSVTQLNGIDLSVNHGTSTPESMERRNKLKLFTETIYSKLICNVCKM